MKRILVFLFCLSLLASCKKENSSARWDVNILSPIFIAELGINDIVPDSLMQVAPDGAVTLVFDSNLYSTPVDSIFKIQDTLQTVLFISPGFITLNPGFVFYSQPNEIDLDLNNVELSEAIVKSGTARLTARNHLATPVIYTFNIPKATLNGIPFQKIQQLDAAPSGGFSEFIGSFDLSGYRIDLTGVTGTDYNNLTYTVEGKTSPTGSTINLLPNDTVVDISSGFESLLPLYAKGYLGQGSVSVSEATSIGTGKFQNGTILLDSVSATLTIKNSVGAEAQAILTSMQSVNERTGTTVSLIAPTLVNRIMNLNRASETGAPPSPVNSTYYVIELDNSNSNLVDMIENLPEKLAYSMDFSVNPLGNVSGHHDFLYTDELFDVNLKVRMPLRFAANQILFIDTSQLTAIAPESNDRLGDGLFTLIADNGFPYAFDVQLFFLDETMLSMDSLLVPGIISAAALDGNFRAVGTQRTKIQIPLSVERRNRLLNAPYVAIRASFSTQSYPQLLQVYSDYKLTLRLIGDFIYSIR